MCQSPDEHGENAPVLTFCAPNFQVPSVADVSVAKSCTPGTQAPGGTVTCTLTVSNAGPNAAQNVVVTDDLPAGTTLVGPLPPGCTNQSPSNPELSCNLGTLGAGQTQTITYTVRITRDRPSPTPLG